MYAARKARLPLVYEMRATWEDGAVDHGTTTRGSLRYRLSRAGETFVLRCAHHVTTICEGLRREIVCRGVPAAGITVIPNAVAIDRFSYHGEPGTELKRKLGLEDAVTVGFIGSFYGYEGLDLLIEAVAILRGAGTDVHALLVGGGPAEASLRALVARKGLGDRVRFCGQVPHDDVRRYYDAIDVLVYPRKRTRLTELVTPLKPLEAMAQGNIFLASDVGGHRELIRDGETGTLFAADDVVSLVDALRALLRDRSRWATMRERALRYVREERNWQRSVSGYRHAYGQALAAFGRGSALI
jgi:PEP-CTERM/exosortase A-associated glycosyltransferase